MEYLVGVGLALVIGVFGTLVGFDRQRAFYSTVLIVVASYYGLFAVMGGSAHALMAECAIIGVFVIASILGFKFNMWIVVAGLAGHGVLDSFHGHVVENPGIPAWWPMFCMNYDCTAAAYLACLELRGRRKAIQGSAGARAT